MLSSLLTLPTTKRDLKRMKRYRKPYIKAAFRGFLFVAAVLIYSVLSYFNNLPNEGDSTFQRRLSEADGGDACGDLKKADPPWLAALMFVGVLYTFIAIAIVCDELFVPALEEIASEHHMNLSMDVAGATLMAAGGSAPELFTSIFGTFVQESEVGIGTVVGSAVFNVLFVIAMCALLTKEVLALTWWPLFRDSVCYSLGLIMLGVFVGVISPAEIELWEAIVLFLMYVGYVIIMYFNRRIYTAITTRFTPTFHPEPASASSNTESNGEGKENGNGTEEAVGEVPPASERVESTIAPRQSLRDSMTSSQHAAMRRSMRRGPSLKSMQEIKFEESVNVGMRSIMEQVEEEDGPDGGADQPWPGTFRSGVLKILRNPKHSWKDTAGVGIVAVMAGDVHHVFKQVDKDSSGDIDKEELALLFAELECSVPPEGLDTVMEELDDNNDGKVTEEDFVKWYVRSEKHMSTRTQVVFDYFDKDKSGKITRESLKTLLANVEPMVTDTDVELAMSAMYLSGSKDEISYEEFSNWYNHCMIHQKKSKTAADDEDDEGDIWESVYPPEIEGEGFFPCFWAYLKYFVVLPIVLVLAFTVPDVRREGWEKWCYVSFLMSILWIGFFAYFMVDWAETIGHTMGIPSVIMGLTLLAAGTSVPDLLTSVIVARMGEGDMALSSSIGSNIFDILVGLPIPWIAYTAYKEQPIAIGSDEVWVYIFTLLGMLVFVVVATHCQGWKLTKTLAVFMLVFYFGFLAMAIILELPFECQ